MNTVGHKIVVWGTGMSELGHTLPTREWYSLEQAIKRIHKLTGETLEVAELIHFWLIGKLNIAINVFFSDHSLKYISDGNARIVELASDEMIIGNKIIEIDKINHYIYQRENNIENKTFFKNEKFILSCVEFNDSTKKNKEKNFKALQGFFFDENYNTVHCLVDTAKGLFYLETYGNAHCFSKDFYRIEQTLKNTNKIPYDFISSLFQIDNESGKAISIVIASKEKNYIELEELYITNDSLENFVKGEEQPKPKKIGAKTLNSQAEFIRNLITIHYGEKVANNIRNELENSRSRIASDFDKSGLKAASGKTVDGWINQP